MSTLHSTPDAATSQAAPPRDARSFWRILLAVAAPIGPVAAALADLIQPWKYSATPTDVVKQIAGHTGAETATVWLHVVSAALFIAGVIAVCWITRRRAPVLTAAGGVLSAFGILIQAQLPSLDLIALAGINKGIDPGTLGTLLTAVNNHPVEALGIFAFLSHVAGQILLGTAIWRTRVAPWWLGLALLASGPLQMAGGATSSVPVAVAGWLLNAAGFLAATLVLMHTPNDQFDLPPVPKGA